MRLISLAVAAALALSASRARAEDPPAPPGAPAQSTAPAVAASDDAALRLDLARQIVALRSPASEMQLFRAKLPWYTGMMRANVRMTDAQRDALPRILEEQYRAALVPEHENVAANYARLFTAAQLREVLAFNNSETGRAWLSHQDELTQASLNLQRVVDLAVLAGATQALQGADPSQQ
ncbi:MAG: DUF2059 domain-containing protein [Proteobacteria bacterium]|nr:DUF2059 domain-containing protein [Pseudomonadota bacterium]